jgi:hypothetical protein
MSLWCVFAQPPVDAGRVEVAQPAQEAHALAEVTVKVDLLFTWFILVCACCSCLMYRSKRIVLHTVNERKKRATCFRRLP